MTDELPAPPRRPRRRPTTAASTPEPGAPVAAVSDAVEAPAVEAGVPPMTVVRMERGGIDEVAADRVEVSMGGIGRLDARDVHVRLGGIGAARAGQIHIEQGSVGAALAGELRVYQGMAGNVVARDVVVEQGLVRTLIAQHVTIARPTGVLVMIAGRVSGNVRPVLDWRGALAFGAAFGLLSGLARLARGRR